MIKRYVSHGGAGSTDCRRNALSRSLSSVMERGFQKWCSQTAKKMSIRNLYVDHRCWQPPSACIRCPLKFCRLTLDRRAPRRTHRLRTVSAVNYDESNSMDAAVTWLPTWLYDNSAYTHSVTQFTRQVRRGNWSMVHHQSKDVVTTAAWRRCFIVLDAVDGD